MAIRSGSLLFLAAVAAITVACRAEPTSPPSPFNLLDFNTRISKNVIHVGDTATIEFVLRNATSESVRFFSGCGLIKPSIKNSARRVVFHSGDYCFASVVPIELAPGEEFVQRVGFRAAARVEIALFEGLP